jgi:hypothetical protein
MRSSGKIVSQTVAVVKDDGNVTVPICGSRYSENV